VLEVKIDDVAFSKLLRFATQTTVDHVALAMAKAMPWGSQAARSMIDRRTRLYAALWKDYLANPNRSYRDYAGIARSTLQQMDNAAEVGGMEADFPAGSAKTAWPISFAEMIRLNGSRPDGFSGIAADWEQFKSAITDLVKGIDAKDPYLRFKTVFSN